MNKLLLVFFFTLLGFSTPSNAILVCNDGYGNQFVWYVGYPVTPALDFTSNINQLTCHASGAEYVYITDKMDNLPILQGNRAEHVVWRGETVRFILDNLGN